jgi:hypothetical protein
VIAVRRGAAGALLLALASGMLSGCGAGSLWNVGQLEGRHPAVADARGHRLADLVPYVWPHEGELLWFLCRWDETAPIQVGFAESVSAREAEVLTRALELWELALPGMRFQRVDVAKSPQIRVSVGSASEGYSGQTRAECLVDPASVTDGAERVSARLLQAEVVLRRSDIDKLGRPVALSEDQFLATAAHELGHALGFQGHVVGAPSVMRAEVGRVRAMGVGLLEGRPLHEPTLRALYAVPSGTVVSRGTWPHARSALVAQLVSRAQQEGYVGPTVRVGDRAARLSWWRSDGRHLGVRLGNIKSALRRGETFEFEPDLLAQALLGR